jgi:phospholipid/cholesterol/gamma-HCH transport system ATP-binding protein
MTNLVADAPSTAMITVTNLAKRFDDNPVLEDISFTVDKGQILAIIGASGCGKSTLLRILAGLETYDSGQLQLGDENITLVFQYSALFDSLSVFDNVAFTLTEQTDFGPSRKLIHHAEELTQKVRDALDFVGLEPDEVMHLYPSNLSGGMQKRVSFARAIISQPGIILYDEPTAGLDPIASQVIEDDIVKVRHKFQTTSIVVTHQRSTIMRTADRILLLDDGHIGWLGTKAEFMTSSDHPLLSRFRAES